MGLNTRVFLLSVNRVSRRNGLNECSRLGKIRSGQVKFVSVKKNKAKRT